MVIQRGILWIISIGEVWMCYQFMYLTVLKKEYMTKAEGMMSWINVIVLGSLLSVNRLTSFYSMIMLIFCIIVTSVFIGAIQRKDFLWIVGMNMLFYSLLAWLDLLFAFISMEFLQGKFRFMVYMRATTYINIGIYFISRLIVGAMLYLVYKKKTMIALTEYRNIFSVMGVVLCILLRKYQIILDGMTTGEQEMRAAKGSVSLAIAFSIVLIIFIFISKYQVLKKERAVLHLKEELLEEKQCISMKNRYLAHDMKNHFMILKGYRNRGEWEKLSEYLDEISDGLMNTSMQPWTGNGVLDFLLNQKMEKAKSEGIDIDIEAGIIHRMPFSDSEMISLYGNLLDNAIEACENIKGKKKNIRVRTEKKKDMLFIEVWNNFENPPIIKNGNFITRKQGKDTHGFGIKSVKRIVDKYEGLFSYQIKENVFQVNITFFDSEIDHR